MISREQVRNAIYRLRRKWGNEGYNPTAINCGNCDSFAQDLLDIFPEGYMAWGEEIPSRFKSGVCPDGHCFFVLHGLYFDSECPFGVSSPDQLPFYKRANKKPKIA